MCGLEEGTCGKKLSPILRRFILRTDGEGQMSSFHTPSPLPNDILPGGDAPFAFLISAASRPAEMVDMAKVDKPAVSRISPSLSAAWSGKSQVLDSTSFASASRPWRASQRGDSDRIRAANDRKTAGTPPSPRMRRHFDRKTEAGRPETAKVDENPPSTPRLKERPVSVTSVPRLPAGAISERYTGPKWKANPSPTPVTILPARRTVNWGASPIRRAPRMNRNEAMRMHFCRPMRSARRPAERTPMMDTYVRAETKIS